MFLELGFFNVICFESTCLKYTVKIQQLQTNQIHYENYRYIAYKTYKMDAVRIEIPVIMSNCFPENTLVLKLIEFK